MIPIISVRIFVKLFSGQYFVGLRFRSRSPFAVTRQHFAHSLDHFSFRHGALRLGLLLQMLFAAFFLFGKLGADDQVLDGDFAAGFFVGALDDDTR